MGFKKSWHKTFSHQIREDFMDSKKKKKKLNKGKLIGEASAVVMEMERKSQDEHLG